MNHFILKNLTKNNGIISKQQIKDLPLTLKPNQQPHFFAHFSKQLRVSIAITNKLRERESPYHNPLEL